MRNDVLLLNALLMRFLVQSTIFVFAFLDTPDAYCVVTCKDPRQKKKTAAITGSKEPYWNESFVL